jgi:hypothetical protein
LELVDDESPSDVELSSLSVVAFDGFAPLSV